MYIKKLYKKMCIKYGLSYSKKDLLTDTDMV